MNIRTWVTCLILYYCGCMQKPTDTGINFRDDIQPGEYVVKSVAGDWRPRVTHNANRSVVDIELNVFCREFHNKTPTKGQNFGTATLGSNSLETEIAQCYETQTILAERYGTSKYVEMLRAPLNQLKSAEDDNYSRFRKISFVETSGINELFASLHADSISEKWLLDRAFQISVWIVRDGLTENNFITASTWDEQTRVALVTLLENSEDETRLTEICVSMQNAEKAFDVSLFKVARGIIETARNYLAVEGKISEDTMRSPIDKASYDIEKARTQGKLRYTVQSQGGYDGRSLVLHVESVGNSPMLITVPSSLIFNSNGISKHLANNNIGNYCKDVGFDKEGTARLIRQGLGLAKSQASVQSMMGGSSVTFELNAPISTDLIDQRDSFTISKDSGSVKFLPWQRDEKGRFYRYVLGVKGAYKMQSIAYSSGTVCEAGLTPTTTTSSPCVPLANMIKTTDSSILADSSRLQEKLDELITEALINELDNEPGDVSSECGVETRDVTIEGNQARYTATVEFTRCVIRENGDIIYIISNTNVIGITLENLLTD